MPTNEHLIPFFIAVAIFAFVQILRSRTDGGRS